MCETSVAFPHAYHERRPDLVWPTGRQLRPGHDMNEDDHRVASGYVGKKVASSSSVFVQMISLINLYLLSTQNTGRASIIFLY